MSRAITAAAFTALAAIGAPAAKAQAPPREYSMPTSAIARKVARDIVRVEICGLQARPLPFNHSDQPYRRTALFRALVQREIAKLEALMDVYGDAAICECLAARRATCP